MFIAGFCIVPFIVNLLYCVGDRADIRLETLSLIPGTIMEYNVYCGDFCCLRAFILYIYIATYVKLGFICHESWWSLITTWIILKTHLYWLLLNVYSCYSVLEHKGQCMYNEQCTYNITLRHLYVTIVALEEQ
jgi:hypothetical protein